MINKNKFYSCIYTMFDDGDKMDSYVIVFDDESYFHIILNDVLEIYFENVWDEYNQLCDDYGEFSDFTVNNGENLFKRFTTNNYAFMFDNIFGVKKD